MKKIMFLAAAVAVIGYYALPVFIASAGGADLTVPSLGPSAVATLHLRVTAYSSEVDQTDSTPFITADGSHVHDGVVATNLLPFGTKVEIPTLFGNKIFTVNDRMNVRMKNGLDVWMPTTAQALRFGANYADVVVLANQTSSIVADVKN